MERLSGSHGVYRKHAVGGDTNIQFGGVDVVVIGTAQSLNAKILFNNSARRHGFMVAHNNSHKRFNASHASYAGEDSMPI